MRPAADRAIARGVSPLGSHLGHQRHHTARTQQARLPALDLVHEHPKELFKKVEAAGVKYDFREPNVIRAASTPLYNTFHEVWRFAQILAERR